jgi:hypothetical protein
MVLEKFWATYKRFIKMTQNEDFERVFLTDQMYLQEKQREIEEEWEQWELEQSKLPAKIVILNPVTKKEEIK